MPEKIVALKVSAETYEATAGHGAHVTRRRWQIHHGLSGEGVAPDPAKVPDIFTVYTTTELDQKLQGIHTNLTKQLNDLAGKLPNDIKSQLDPQIKSLFDSLAQAKEEIARAVVEDVRKDLHRIIEEEVRRILPTLL